MSPNFGLTDGAQINVIGTGVNACSDWTYRDTGSGNGAWILNSYLLEYTPVAPYWY